MPWNDVVYAHHVGGLPHELMNPSVWSMIWVLLIGVGTVLRYYWQQLRNHGQRSFRLWRRR